MRRKRDGIDKEKKRDNIFTIILSICDVIAVIVLFLLYGPYNNFRDWLVTTAMSTMRHQYIARTFYNDETINKILERHSMIEPDGNTDTSLILEEDNNYKDKYDKEPIRVLSKFFILGILVSTLAIYAEEILIKTNIFTGKINIFYMSF